MKILIFVDDSNFKANIKCINEERKQDRVIDYHKIHRFVLEYLLQNPQYNNEKLTHIRTYIYTGEYTDALFQRIKHTITNETNPTKKSKFEYLLSETERFREGQKKFLEKAATFNFFEIRKKPLQFTQSKGVFQKGVDVQLAVDLVSNAYLNNYDIAALFSGDIDLLESLKLIKNLGKQIIIFSHYRNVAKEMVRESDLLVDFQKLDNPILDKFTHIFEKKASSSHENTTTKKPLSQIIMPSKKNQS